MSRRSKILFVVGCGVAGLLAWVFLSGEDKGEVSLNVSRTSSGPISLSITNGLETDVFYSVSAEAFPAPGLQVASVAVGPLLSHSEKTVEIPPFSTTAWRFVLTYSLPISSSFAGTARNKAAMYAWRNNWKRLSQWLSPESKTKTIYGPVVLDQKQVEPAPK